MNPRFALASLTLGLLPACGSPAHQGSNGKWVVVASPTSADALLSLWGSAPSNLWIGSTGVVLHWDGNTFTPYDGPWYATSIWGSAADDVWIGGGTASTAPAPHAGHRWVTRWNGTALEYYDAGDNREIGAVWGTSTSNVWGLSSNAGYVGHWDGTAWSAVNTAGEARAMWGAAADDAWGVGTDLSNGRWAILHEDGGPSPWTVYGLSSLRLNGIWGSAADDVWAAGDNGLLSHWDGALWTESHAPTTLSIKGLWGTAANDIWAVGENGILLRFDGSGWSSLPSPTSQTLWATWGDASSGQIWAVGEAGTILSYKPG